MEPEFSIPILIVGAMRVVIWAAGAALAYHRRRWAVASGFALAAANAGVFAYVNAHGTLPQALVDAASIASTIAVGLIVFGFTAAQPKRAPRPHTWTP